MATDSNVATGWLLGLAGTLLVPLLWSLAGKSLSSFLAAKFVSAVDEALAEGDEDDDRLVMEIVRWVDKKSDKALSKEDKIRAYTNALCSRISIMRGQEEKLLGLVEKVLKAVDEKAHEIESRPAEQKEP